MRQYNVEIEYRGLFGTTVFAESKKDAGDRAVKELEKEEGPVEVKAVHVEDARR